MRDIRVKGVAELRTWAVDSVVVLPAGKRRDNLVDSYREIRSGKGLFRAAGGCSSVG